MGGSDIRWSLKRGIGVAGSGVGEESEGAFWGIGIEDWWVG